MHQTFNAREQKKFFKCLFSHYSKNASHKKPERYDQPNLPIAPILQRQSKHIQTHVHFNNFPGDFVIPDTFVFPKLMLPLHKEWSFPLRTSSENVTKSADSCGFGHIYWRNP